MNPTQDKLTAELQQKTHIEPPVVVGEGQHTTETSTGEKLSAATHTIASGVETTVQKLGAGLEYTGEKIGEALSGVVPTIAATGDQIEKSIQKAADAVAEEEVKLPGVVTLLQSGAARIFGHLTGTSENATQSTEGTISAPIQETIVYSEKNFVGDIITTDIQTGHVAQHATSRVDVLKESGQLSSVSSELHQPTSSELHLPHLKVHDVPLNRAVEEPSRLDIAEQKDIAERKDKALMEQQFPSFVYIHEQQTTPLLSAGHATSTSQVSNSLEYKDELEQQLPNLTKKVVHDGAAFMRKIEQLDTPHPPRKSSVVNQSSEQFPKKQLPNLPTKAVHDCLAFIDKVQQLDSAQHTQHKSKDLVNESRQLPKQQLPNLTSKVVHDGVAFIDRIEHDVVENSGQSM